MERFNTFIPNCRHKAEELAQTVLDTLQKSDLQNANCRAQLYDNASNMAGTYSGHQARIKQVNHLAMYVPCSAHSLNLVGSCTAECFQSAVTLFAALQQLYYFFSASPEHFADALETWKYCD